MASRDEIMYNLYLEMQRLEQEQPPGWETEYNMHRATFDSMEAEIPDPSKRGVNPRNIGEAVLNRLPKSIAGVVDTGIALTNWPFSGTQRDEAGFIIRDEVSGKPLAKEPLIDFRLGDMVSDPEGPFADTSAEILGDNKWATGVDLSTDAMMFTLPMTPVISGTARLFSFVPGLRRITNPFMEFQMGRDLALAGAGGAFGAAYSDEEGTPSLAAEILGPLGLQSGPGAIRAVLRKFAPRFGGGIEELSEHMAHKILTKALDDAGMTIDEAVDIYAKRGAEGLPTDIDDAFRTVLRESRSQGAVTGTQTRALRQRVEGDMRNINQTGGTGRINDFIGREMGTMDGAVYLRNLDAQSQNQINELYQVARDQGKKPLPSQLRSVLGDAADDTPRIVDAQGTPFFRGLDVEANPTMQNAIKQAKIIRMNEVGSAVFDNNFDYINYIKMALDDQISKAMAGGTGQLRSKARSIILLKNRMVDAADAHFPGYKEARNAFAGVQELKNAVESGRNILKIDPTIMEDMFRGMGESEMNAFRVGARDSMLDAVATTPITGNPARKLVRNPQNIERMRHAFPDEGSLNRFLDAVEREGEFIRTRNFVLGGSQTFDKWAATQQMQANVRGIMVAANDPTGISQVQFFANLINRLTKDRGSEVYKRALAMTSDVLLNSNLSPQQVRQALTKGNIRSLIEPIALSVWGREAIPRHMINAIRGMTIVEASQWINNERDREEKAQDEASSNRRADIRVETTQALEDPRN